MVVAEKKTKGRRKIEIKKIENKANLSVSFTKRRFGLFKKASELCILCGAKVAILVKSPAGRIYSFGQPSVEALFAPFLTTAAISSPPLDIADIPFVDDCVFGDLTPIEETTAAAAISSPPLDIADILFVDDCVFGDLMPEEETTAAAAISSPPFDIADIPFVDDCVFGGEETTAAAVFSSPFDDFYHLFFSELYQG